MSSEKLTKIAQLIDAVRSFRFCGPSDDPDEQTAVTVGFNNVVTQLKRLSAPLLPESERQRLEDLNVEIDNIYSVYSVNAELSPLLYDIEAALSQTDGTDMSVGPSRSIISKPTIDQLANCSDSDFDSEFLTRLCREINSAFAHGNTVATALTMRAVMNYIPPLFGHTTFDQVVAQSGRSLKDSFSHLQDGLRKIADFHTHRTMKRRDIYPTVAQIEPFKPQFELLLHEIVSKLNERQTVA